MLARYQGGKQGFRHGAGIQRHCVPQVRLTRNQLDQQEQLDQTEFRTKQGYDLVKSNPQVKA